MAIKITYALRESAQNLRRNLLMTLSAVMTVTISLALVGAALLLRHSVSNATVQFRGGIELTVYMNEQATPQQIDDVKRELDALSGRQVKKYRFVNQDEALREFRQIFRNDPDMLASITTPAELPPSFRISPRDAADIEVIGSRFRNRAGVFKVQFARDAVKTILAVTDWLQAFILGTALALLGSAVLLILNTIRMAIFARRREVAVMKLVGATNWFIRIPFMVEGMLQGIIGALAADVMLGVGSSFLQGRIRSSTITLFKQFSVTTGQVTGTMILILVIGTAVGAIGSAIAVSRFLDV